MGRTFIEGFLAEGVEQDRALEIHLLYNHYPPVSTDFIPACKEAIENAECEKWDAEIVLPNGKIVSAQQVIEGLHLDAFLEYDEYEAVRESLEGEEEEE